MSEFTTSLPPGAEDALLAFAIAAVIGLVVDQMLFRFLSSRAAATQWAPGRGLAAGLHGMPTAIGVLLGAHLALQRLVLSPALERNAAMAVRIATILTVTAFAARVIGRIVQVYTDREGSRLPSTSIFVNLARALIWVLGGISLLAALGVSIAPLVTALGVGGLAVGLALQPTLENVFSGIQVLASRQIEPGDLIRLETGEEGAVLDVTWRNTTIMTPSNDLIVVPNSIIGRSRITNFSTLSGEHVLIVPIAIAAHGDTALVERCVQEAAEEVSASVEGVVADTPPTVRFAAVTQAGIQVNVGIRVASYPERIPVRHELIKRVQQRFAAEGIEFASGMAVPVQGASGAARA